MKLKNKSFRYGVKRSKNYQSVDVSESIEIDTEGDTDLTGFDVMKQELIERVNVEAENQLLFNETEKKGVPVIMTEKEGKEMDKDVSKAQYDTKKEEKGWGF